MRKNRLKILTIIFLIIMIILIGNMVYYYRNKDNHTKKNNSKDTINEKDIKYLTDDGRTINVDGNTITLEKYFFDKEINDGYFLISIMQEGKKAKNIFSGWYGPCILFGGKGYDDSTYYIDYQVAPTKSWVGGLDIKKTKYEGNKKYIYIKIDMRCNPDEFKDTLVLKDTRIELPAKDPNSLGIGSFKLEDNAIWKTFSNGDDKVEVNNFSVRVNDGKEKNISDFTIYMKNGVKHTISDKDMVEVTYEYADNITRLRFNESIDIDKIDYIMWKGKKLQE